MSGSASRSPTPPAAGSLRPCSLHDQIVGTTRRRSGLVATSALRRRAVVRLSPGPPLLSLEAMDEGEHAFRQRPSLVRRLRQLVGRRHGSAIGETCLDRESFFRPERRETQRLPRWPRRKASSRRRACFVGRVPRSAPRGRESRRSAACRSRARSDSGVSVYSVSASLAEPRLTATSVTTSVRRSALMVTSIVSPVRTTFEGFTRSPFRCTRPPRTAPVAALRVLNMRAAQSHLSIRT
jgi:hypothetical protein